MLFRSIVLDWETAGVGVPSIDFKLLGDDLDYYVATMGTVWPESSLSRVKALADVGRIFRSLAVIHWASWNLEFPWCSFRVFNALESRLEAAAHSLEAI